MIGAKDKLKLHNETTQILEVLPYKTAAIWPLTTILQTIQDEQNMLSIAGEVRTNS